MSFIIIISAIITVISLLTILVKMFITSKGYGTSKTGRTTAVSMFTFILSTIAFIIISTVKAFNENNMFGAVILIISMLMIAVIIPLGKSIIDEKMNILSLTGVIFLILFFMTLFMVIH